MDRPRLFLSAVSQELRTARQAVAATVRTLGYDPVSQDAFPTGYGELRRWLCQQIDESEGLIQLVGQAYGAESPSVDPAYGRVSYTQMEFLYASRQGKKTWVIVIGGDYPRDKPLEQLDLPDDAAHPDPGNYQTDRRVLQHGYVDQLKRDNHLRHTVQNQAELENTVLRLRDELGELRRGEQRRWQRLTATVTAIVLGLALLGGGGWWAYKTLRSDVQQVAVVDEAKIRAHLRKSADETYRRELADADAVTSWEERERLRKAAETANDNRLSRIKDLVATFAEIAGTGTATNVFEEMKRILRDEGVDEAITYVTSQRKGILEHVRTRVAATRARNRAEMQPLLQTAALYQTKGQDAEARALYNEILAVDQDWAEARHSYFWFLADQGDAARVRGSLFDAERDYGHAHRLAQRLAARDPANTEWQRDLSVSLDRVGDIKAAQGDLAGALGAYEESKTIRERLAESDPSNAGWQRDLVVSLWKLSQDGLAEKDAAQGYLKRALEILESLETARKLHGEHRGWPDLIRQRLETLDTASN